MFMPAVGVEPVGDVGTVTDGTVKVTAWEVVLSTRLKFAAKLIPEIALVPVFTVKLISAANPERLIMNKPKPENDRNDAPGGPSVIVLISANICRPRLSPVSVNRRS